MKPAVFIGTPIHKDEVCVRYDASQSATERCLRAAGIPYWWTFQTGAEADRARNYMVAQFLAREEYTHLCFIDSDEGWTEDTIPKLLNHNVDLIGVPVMKKIEVAYKPALDLKGKPLYDAQGRPCVVPEEDPEWNFYSQEPAQWDGRKLFLRGPLSYIGTGIMLLSRACLRKMIDHYEELRVRVEYKGVEEEAKPHLAALFQRTIQDGEYAGEDVSFCRRWGAIGGEIYADPTIEVCHVGSREWKGRFSDFMKFEEDAEAAA